jgi:pimeloyl-ACP methyl ester carboxylesterase
MIQNRNGKINSLAAFVFIGALAGCGDGSQPSTRTASLATTDCRVPGVDVAVKCATLEVFENRETKTGRKIGLNIVVYPASARIKEPDPIFVFAGGPGQAATDLVGTVAPVVMSGLTAKRDVVFIDQRGTGKSNLLNCKFPDDDTPEMANPATRRAFTQKLVSECRETLSKRADLTQYGTTNAMADYDAVRQALGYEKINLWGASYGTRAALEYLRRFPERVRTLTIDGVASPNMALPESFSRDAGAALEAAFAACEKANACETSYPNLRADFSALLTRLDKAPQRVSLRNPTNNLPRETTVTRQGLSTMVFSTLYVPQLVSVLPEAMHQATLGNYAPMLALSGGFADFAEDKIAFGMRLSVNCAEDVPRISDAQRLAAEKLPPFGDSFIREFSTACEVWPKGKVAADFHEPVKSDMPVLILSGGLDPVTPPGFGDEVKRSLPNSLHFVAPNVGHGVSTQGCAPKLIKRFIEKASVAELDGECLKRVPRPTFYQAMIDKKAPPTAAGEKK